MSSSRAGINAGPCENFDPATSFVQTVTAGSRLKIGWLSGNRGGRPLFSLLNPTSTHSDTTLGGYVKLSMAPASSNIQQSSFDS